MSTPLRSAADDIVVPDRPRVGAPRRYDFPAVTAHRLSNGLSILVADLPGRPLVSASVVVLGGASQEPAELAGSTVLAARALSEGTGRYDAIALVEAAERLGASIHADAGWDALNASVEVPADRLAPALELVAEMLLRPTFPESEVERLRDERLNDLLQARADPRRRAEQAFADTIYDARSPYHRPSGGTRETVERLTAADLRSAYERYLDPRRATLVVGGDLGGQDVVELAERLFGSWKGSASAPAGGDDSVVDTAASDRRIVRVVHRPGSVQTEIRIGHRGLPRRIPDFHAVSVMSAILGGLFNSRLNMKLREEKGYTYGAGAGFDLRRGAGPFAARAAVNTDVTVVAALDMLTELNRMREEPVSSSELTAARDFLIGVFPLRFETSGAVVGAVSGLAVHGLPLEELIDYRARIEAVDGPAVEAAARAHLHVDSAAIVLVGDVDAFGPELEAAGLGRIVIERDEIVEPAPPPEPEVATPGPVDREDEEGPTAGAEEPELPGVPEGAEHGS
ncbi:MAG TPA: pitrilysin family protein [Candidatus Limnocylindrales bacterium]